MPKIGSFFKVSAYEYLGEVVTLSVQAANVRIVPQDLDSGVPDAPTHRVLIGRTEVGAGWVRHSDVDRSYLELTIDDPSFVEPIKAILVENENSDFDLIWDR